MHRKLSLSMFLANLLIKPLERLKRTLRAFRKSGTASRKGK